MAFGAEMEHGGLFFSSYSPVAGATVEDGEAAETLAPLEKSLMDLI